MEGGGGQRRKKNGPACVSAALVRVRSGGCLFGGLGLAGDGVHVRVSSGDQRVSAGVLPSSCCRCRRCLRALLWLNRGTGDGARWERVGERGREEEAEASESRLRRCVRVPGGQVSVGGSRWGEEEWKWPAAAWRWLPGGGRSRVNALLREGARRARWSCLHAGLAATERSAAASCRGVDEMR